MIDTTRYNLCYSNGVYEGFIGGKKVEVLGTLVRVNFSGAIVHQECLTEEGVEKKLSELARSKVASLFKE